MDGRMDDKTGYKHGCRRGCRELGVSFNDTYCAGCKLYSPTGALRLSQQRRAVRLHLRPAPVRAQPSSS